MTDSAQVLQRFRIGALVGTYWLVAAAAPFMFLGVVHRPGALTTILFGVIAGYFSYTGYRAWKRGWKARFILRVVVPAFLFLATSIGIGLVAKFP